MNSLKKTVLTVFSVMICIALLTGCTLEQKKEALDVKKVSYLVLWGDRPEVELYIITSDRKVIQYNIRPEEDKTYDYLAGELPSEDNYEVTEYEMTEASWNSLVNTLTEADFMNLLEEFQPDDSDDSSSYYIRVETSDDVHQSGGYNAGGHMDPESRRFSNARQAVDRALNRNVY